MTEDQIPSILFIKNKINEFNDDFRLFNISDYVTHGACVLFKKLKVCLGTSRLGYT